MEMTIRKNIGNQSYTFIVSGKNLHELVMESEKLAFPDVKECGICRGTNLRLTAYETAEDHYKYVKVACNSCRGSLTFGQPKKSPDTFYLRKKKDGQGYDWQKFVPREAK